MAETTVSFDYDSLVSCEGSRAEAPCRQDEELVAALQQGVEEAYERLVRLYQQPVYNLVYRLLDEPSDCDDVVQWVFVKVFRHIGSFRGQSSLKTWIYRIAVNEAQNHRRWFGRRRRREIGLEHEDSGAGRAYGEVLPDPARSPFELMLAEETLAIVEKAIFSLKPVFREAVVLRDIEELSYEEIAQVLGVSLGTVESRILRGREALRKELESRLVRPERAIGLTPQPAEQD